MLRFFTPKTRPFSLFEPIHADGFDKVIDTVGCSQRRVLRYAPRMLNPLGVSKLPITKGRLFVVSVPCQRAGEVHA